MEEGWAVRVKMPGLCAPPGAARGLGAARGSRLRRSGRRSPLRSVTSCGHFSKILGAPAWPKKDPLPIRQHSLQNQVPPLEQADTTQACLTHAHGRLGHSKPTRGACRVLALMLRTLMRRPRMLCRRSETPPAV